MAEFTLGIRNFDEDGDFPVATSQYIDGTEGRRQTSDVKAASYGCVSPTLTEAQIGEYRAFHEARKGKAESFTWDSGAQGVLTVRFDSGMKIKHHYDGWSAEWTFKVVNNG